MAPIPSKTHTAGEAFGWQMPPRGQRRRIKRKARSLPATNNLERLLCKLLERMYMYRTPWMGLSWRPSSAGRFFGNVELLGYLTCQIHVHWAFQVACGSCLVYLAIIGLYLIKKSQKSYTCNHVSEALTGLFSKKSVMKNCARRVYSLKRMGTLFRLISLKPDQIDKCNFGTTRASKQRRLHAWSLHMHVLDVQNCSQIQKGEGLLAYDI